MGIKRRFSERYGYKKIRDKFQMESIDAELKVALWNVFYEVIWNKIMISRKHYDIKRNLKILESLWKRIYKRPVNEIPKNPEYFLNYIIFKFDNFNWFEIYDFLEYFLDIDFGEYTNIDYKSKLNEELKIGMSYYNVVDNKIAPITNEHEIEAIEEAVNMKSKFSGARKHFIAALDFFSDRKNPDYRNSIKESISGIESVGKTIINDENADLGKILPKLENKIKMNSQLKASIQNLYNYTNSNEVGARHGSTKVNNQFFDEAKLMLVTCSAFANYLIAKSEK